MKGGERKEGQRRLIEEGWRWEQGVRKGKESDNCKTERKWRRKTAQKKLN